MIIEIKKEITETVQVEHPCYYKRTLLSDTYCHINEAGVLIEVRPTQITIWHPKDGKYFNEHVQEMVEKGTVCTREEFEEMFHKTIIDITGLIQFEGTGALAE